MKKAALDFMFTLLCRSGGGGFKLCYFKKTMNHRSRVVVVAVCLAVAGCAEGAQLIQDRDDGGVVAYPFKGEQGHMLSSFRKDALSLMQQKCGGAYTIVREGESKGRERVAGAVQGSQEIVQERRWGIEFRCK